MIYSLKKCAMFLVLNYFFFFVVEIFNDVFSSFNISFYMAAIPVASAWFVLAGFEAFITLLLLGFLIDAANEHISFGLTGLVQVSLYFFLLCKKNLWQNLPHKEIWITVILNLLLHFGLFIHVIFFRKIPTLFFTGTIFSLLCSLMLSSGVGFVYLLWQKRWFQIHRSQ